MPPSSGNAQGDLREAVAANRAAFAAALRGDADFWDYVVLTASDERQARGYEIEIHTRWERGLLPSGARILVMPDPQGARIGSGGATLMVVRRLAQDISARMSGETLEDLFRRRRILVIHSGGSSKRVPQHACFGKAFARVPVELDNGDTSTLFDELLIAFAGLAARMQGGMAVLSGDVLLTFDQRALPGDIDGVVGVGFKADVSYGRGHGVYVTEPGSDQVRQFMQKVDEAELRAAGAVDAEGRIAVDTGVLLFSPQITAVLGELAGARMRDGELELSEGVLGANCAQVSLHLYDEICGALAASADRETYLARPFEALDAEAGRRAREIIWDRLRGAPFRAVVLEEASFLHFGSTRQYRDQIAAGRAPGYEFAPQLNAYLDPDIECDGGKIYDSTLRGAGRIGPGALVEDCDLRGPFHIEAGAVASGVCFQAEGLHVRSGVVLHQVRCRFEERSALVTLIFGVDDNPKDGFENASFLNEPMKEWLDRRGVHPEELWPGLPAEERRLWNARLFPATNDDSMRLVLWMQEPSPPDPDTLAAWRVADRVSMETAFRYADCERLCRERLRRADDRMLLRLSRAVRTGDDTDTVKLVWQTGRFATFQEAIQLLFDEMAQADPLARARAWKVISDTIADGRYAVLWGRTPGWELPRGIGPSLLGSWRTPDDPIAPETRRALEDALHMGRLPNPTNRTLVDFVRIATEDIAFEHVADAIARGAAALAAGDAPRGERAAAAAARAPARLDFGGGWSDTPPYSQERGGAVLNAAINLDGRPPIQAAARRLDEPRIVLKSADLDEELIVEDAAHLFDFADAESSLSLHKAAVVLVSGCEGAGRLEDVLDAFGSGLEVTSGCAIPKGSGLGSSSIIGLALVACLREMAGKPADDAQLSSDVLRLEQMLTTGGGWQDQLGGMVGGFKLITTEPGFEQRPRIEPITLAPAVDEELSARLVVHWTGIRRLAKRILKTIMGKWLSRHPAVVRVLSEIQDIARSMRDALAGGDIDQLGELMRRHWALNKLMDPHTTNDYIEFLLSSIDDYMCGAKLAGAGGGGFMMIVAKDADAANRIRGELSRLGRETGGGVANAEVNYEGLQVTRSD